MDKALSKSAGQHKARYIRHCDYALHSRMQTILQLLIIAADQGAAVQ